MPPVEVVLLRADEDTHKVLTELMEDFDQVMVVDCADRRALFVVEGFFCFPKRSLLTTRHDQP